MSASTSLVPAWVIKAKQEQRGVRSRNPTNKHQTSALGKVVRLVHYAIVICALENLEPGVSMYECKT